MDTIAVTGRLDLTDAQWAVLEPLLPTAKRPGRPSLWTKRQVIDGMRGGCGWAHPGVTCRSSTGPGRRCMRCFVGGSETAHGARS